MTGPPTDAGFPSWILKNGFSRMDSQGEFSRGILKGDSQGGILKGWILNCRPAAGRRRGSQGAPGRALGQAAGRPVGRRQLRIHPLRIHP